MHPRRLDLMDARNVLLVVGKHDVGKTTFIERLLPFIARRGIPVAVIKDIHLEGFCIDQEGKDTWRHWKAGASIVVARGNTETDILVKRRMELGEILPAVGPADLVIAEGFKELHGRKVIVAREAADLAEMEALLTTEDVLWGIAGPIVESGAYNGHLEKISDDASFDALVDRLEPLAKQRRLDRNRLAMPLEAAGCKLVIDGMGVDMKPYVAETLKNVVLGAIAALHWNVKVPITRVEVSLGKNGGDAGWVAGVEMNGNPLSLKEFVQHSISSVVLGYVATLNLPEPLSVTRAGEVIVDIA
ncbi:MAG: molybdopterin-guanine dinucleotide biosynthesis protein B [Candidatus Lokiarchaeota archaeon]|nr:molybdopterin-guanine dinucleotide biosynthesis protein B [Candidatus Lokiarchaeota archaeon]